MNRIMTNCSVAVWIVLTCLCIASLTSVTLAAEQPQRTRRVLYNFDGDSCLSTKAGSKGPVAVNADDVKRLIEEVAYNGSLVDTVLVCINAQVMYYPTQVGTMRGTLSIPDEQTKWPPSEKQRFENLKAFFDSGVERGDLPIDAWKQAVTSVPVYGGIECTRGGGAKNLTADEYRAAAAHLIKSGSDGVYLFNFFTSREEGANAYEPPFEVLRDLSMM